MPGEIVGATATRMLVRFDRWRGCRNVIKAVRPYRLQRESGGPEVNPMQTSLLGEEPPVAETTSGDAQAVFAAWQEATGRSGTRLDSKRESKIRAALKRYPLADVLDAVRGWQNEPFYCGENDRHTAYNEITMLLRDAEHIERFRDMWRRGKKAVTPTRRAVAQSTHDVRRAFALGEMQ